MSQHESQEPTRYHLSSWLSPRRLRVWREYVSAYLMITPAVILIFVFGIFPVGFALFVSMHEWRLKRGDIIGLSNFTAAVGSLGYLLVFALGIGLLVFAFRQFRQTHSALEAKPLHFWLLNIPGLLLAAAGLGFVRWTVVLLPNLLDIANKITGVEKTRELFIRLLGEAFSAQDVLPARAQMLWLIGIAIVVSVVTLYLWQNSGNIQRQLELAAGWGMLGAGIIGLRFVYTEMMKAYDAALQTGSDPGIVPQLVSIISGVILLYIGWRIWSRADRETGNLHFFIRLFSAAVFIVGGWIMVSELPVIVASGDPDLWVGLRATLFYSLGTIPFQLSISIFLAVLLFQNLKGSQFFRVMFFMPYVTPVVASAAVFRQLFSNRLQAPVNASMRLLGLEPLQWLWEPKGIFTLLADRLGLASWPDWASGPSLALVVIIIFSIWVFVGYDTVIYLAGLGNIPKELGEAAAADGANGWQVFRYITFPMLSPTTYFLTLISVIGTFKAFNHIWILRLDAALQTTDTFSVVIFTEFFEKLRYGYASAMAFVLFAIIMGLTYINNKVQGSRVFYG